MSTNIYACNKCGWIHFGLTKETVEDEVSSFNAFFYASSEETRSMYGNKPSSIETYQKCFKCGNDYTDFRIAKSDEGSFGSTIQPILIYEQ